MPAQARRISDIHSAGIPLALSTSCEGTSRLCACSRHLGLSITQARATHRRHFSSAPCTDARVSAKAPFRTLSKHRGLSPARALTLLVQELVCRPSCCPALPTGGWRPIPCDWSFSLWLLHSRPRQKCCSVRTQSTQVTAAVCTSKTFHRTMGRDAHLFGAGSLALCFAPPLPLNMALVTGRRLPLLRCATPGVTGLFKPWASIVSYTV